MQAMLDQRGHIRLPCRASTMWRLDPKLLLFTLARHKFVAKMLSGYSRVLEVGCGDAFASRLLHPVVKELHAIDFDPYFIEEAKSTCDPEWPVTYMVHDILDAPYHVEGWFDAAFSLDVIEHIPLDKNFLFIKHVCLSLKPGGVFICGAPSLESQQYASPASREGHVNCLNGKDFQNQFLRFFDHAFLFGMNDEVLHTGFAPMCQYLFVVAVGSKA